VTAFLLASIGVAVFGGLADLYVAILASAGTIANAKPRAGVAAWFTVRLCCAVVELGAVCSVLGVLFASGAGCGGGSDYHPAVVIVLAAAACLGAVVNGGLLCGVGALLSCSKRKRAGGRSTAEASSASSDEHLAASSLRWASRCEWLAGMPACCFNSRRKVVTSSGAPSPYAVVGRVMASVFEMTASLRLTVTDVIAGL